MSDTGSNLKPLLPKPSTITVSAARVLSPLTRSDGDRRRDTGGWPVRTYWGAHPLWGAAPSPRLSFMTDVCNPFNHQGRWMSQSCQCLDLYGISAGQTLKFWHVCAHVCVCKEGLVQSLCPQPSAISKMYLFIRKVEIPNIDLRLDCYAPTVPQTCTPRVRHSMAPFLEAYDLASPL